MDEIELKTPNFSHSFVIEISQRLSKFCFCVPKFYINCQLTVETLQNYE